MYAIFQEAATQKLLILAIRSRIEDLQFKKLWPRGVPKASSRRDAFKEILTSQEQKFLNSENVTSFRKAFQQLGVSVDLFVDTIIDLYGEFSDNAVHNVRFPKELKREYIYELLIDLGVTPDDDRVLCVELIMKPLKLKQFVVYLHNMQVPLECLSSE